MAKKTKAKTKKTVTKKAPPPLPMTVGVAAKFHNVSTALVKRWVEQGRVAFQKVPSAGKRASMTLILTYDRPKRAARGTLTAEQREARARHEGREAAPPTKATTSTKAKRRVKRAGAAAGARS